MSKTIELTDEQYEAIEKAAESRGQTASAFLARLIEEIRDPYTTPRYFTDNEFLRHLGMSDDMIQQAETLAADDDGSEDANK
jgi:hypothetical protein